MLKGIVRVVIVAALGCFACGDRVDGQAEAGEETTTGVEKTGDQDESEEDGDGESDGDDDGGTSANPCFTDVTAELDVTEEHIWAGYCAKDGFCGQMGFGDCDTGDRVLYLRFELMPNGKYRVTGFNFNITSSTHGDSTGQTLTQYSNLPADTDITMGLDDGNGGEGSITMSFSGNLVVIAELQDPRFPQG